MSRSGILTDVGSTPWTNSFGSRTSMSRYGSGSFRRSSRFALSMMGTILDDIQSAGEGETENDLAGANPIDMLDG